MENTWNSKKSREFYNIQGWGYGYFDIDKSGTITVKRGKYLADKPVVITDIIDYARAEGMTTPLVLRFTDIIQNRALRIISAFNEAKKSAGYEGNYTLIFPIKVNQNKAVVDSIVNLKSNNRGIEAGSKAELLAALSSIKDNKTPIVCNGYKDREYIRIAMIARKMGRNIIIVIEKMLEAKYVVELAQELEVTPILGVRFRLALTLSGKWAHSGGEKSKFGLNTTQALDLINTLKNNNLLDCLKLLHCHQGSQIANIKDIGHYINELSTVYIKLVKLGVPLNIIDIGGGLAVDYEGSRTRNFNSTNYKLSDYANIIIETIQKNILENNIPAPDIYSESGRAVTAHHAVFVTNIVEIESVVGEEVPEVIGKDEDLLELEELLESFDTLPINEIYSHSVLAIESLHNRFNSGTLSLEKRAVAEQLFSHIKLRLIKKLDRSYRSHRELYDILDEDLAKKVIANFSVFQSIPDSWAISQLLPIMPLTHLNQEPRMRAIIEDLTCDSDGKISNYIDYQGNEPSIKLPQYDPKNPYLLAIFLIGAYQEIMGNMHNLFGPVTTLDISLDGKGNFTIDTIHHGFTNADSLNHVGFNFRDILNQFTQQLDKSKTFTKKQQKEMYKILQNALEARTYLQE
ncbi:MAG: arginine decarboxylase [Pseudomonadota bacterium]|nr:arginine decarboxylase [Pseudomonadota bacterium]